MAEIKRIFPNKVIAIGYQKDIEKGVEEELNKVLSILKKSIYINVNSFCKIICPQCENMLDSTENIIVKDENIKNEIETLNKYSGDWLICKSFYKDANIIIKCPNCGKEITRKNFLKNSKYYYGSEKIPHIENYIIYDDENKITISCCLKIYMYIPKTNLLSRKKYNIRITYNRTSKQWYFLGIHNMKGKLAKELYHKKEIPRMINFTAHNSSVREVTHLVNDLFSNKTFLKDIINILNLKLNSDTITTLFNSRFKNNAFKNNAFEYIRFIDRFPQLKDADCKEIISLQGDDYSYNYKSGKYYFYVKKIFKGINSNDDMSTFFSKLAKNVGVKNNKSFRQIIINNPLKLIDIYVLTKVGFKNFDIIKQMLQISEEHFSKERPLKKIINIMPCFIKDMVKKKGEYFAYKKIFQIFSYPCYYFNLDIEEDIELMYCKIKAENIEFDFKGNLNEIHNELSIIYNKIKNINKDIAYTPSDKKLEETIDEYSFVLAKDTYTLVDIGNKMHICVGSYRDMALARQCIIVSVIKDNTYVGCIELSPKYNLRQAKAFANHLFSKEMFSALEKWVVNHNISTECYDYKQALLAYNKIA